MRKLVLSAIVLTILVTLGHFGGSEPMKPATLSVGANTSQGEDDFRPKRIAPRPEATHVRASRHRRVTKSDKVLTDSSVWDRLAKCESTNNWQANTGNGYYGGIQFDLSSWHSAGGVGYPHNASRAEQIKRGKIWQKRHGWYPWPSCARKLGLL